MENCPATNSRRCLVCTQSNEERATSVAKNGPRLVSVSPTCHVTPFSDFSQVFSLDRLVDFLHQRLVSSQSGGITACPFLTAPKSAVEVLAREACLRLLSCCRRLSCQKPWATWPCCPAQISSLLCNPEIWGREDSPQIILNFVRFLCLLCPSRLSDGLSRRPQSPPPGLLVTTHGRRPLMTGSCWWLSRTYLRDDPLTLEAFMGSLSVTTACVKDAG